MPRRLDETAYLLQSKNNAKRLLAAIESSKRGPRKVQTIDELRKEFGLASAAKKRKK